MVQLTDDEKFLFKPDLKLEEVRWGMVGTIVSCGGEDGFTKVVDTFFVVRCCERVFVFWAGSWKVSRIFQLFSDELLQ